MAAATGVPPPSSIATGSLIASSLRQFDAMCETHLAWTRGLEREFIVNTGSTICSPTPCVGTPVRAVVGLPPIALGPRLNVPIAPTRKAHADLVTSSHAKAAAAPHTSKTTTTTFTVTTAAAAPGVHQTKDQSNKDKQKQSSSARPPLARSNSRGKVAPTRTTAAPPSAAPAPAKAAENQPTKVVQRKPPVPVFTHSTAQPAAAAAVASVAPPPAAEPKLTRQDSRGKRPLMAAAKERAAKTSKAPLTLTCTESEHLVAVRDTPPQGIPIVTRARSRKSLMRRSVQPQAATTAEAPPVATAQATTAPPPSSIPAPPPASTESHAAPRRSVASRKSVGRKSLASNDKPAAPAPPLPTAAVPAPPAPTPTVVATAAPVIEKTSHASSLTAPTAASLAKGRAPLPKAAPVVAAPKVPQSSAPPPAKKPAAQPQQQYHHQQHAQAPVVVVAPPPAPVQTFIAPQPTLQQPSFAPTAAHVTITQAPAPVDDFGSHLAPSQLPAVFRNPAELQRRSSRMMGRPIHRRSLAGMDKEVAERMLARYSLATERAVLQWISALLNEKIPMLEPLVANPSLHVRPILADCLHDGQLLCRLANRLRPGVVSRYNERRVPLYDRENIQLYLTACGRMGLLRQDLFIVSDLYEEKSIPAVLTNLMALGRRFAHVQPSLVLPNAEVLSLDTLINEPGQSAAALAADEARREKEQQQQQQQQTDDRKRKESPVSSSKPAQRRRSEEEREAQQRLLQQQQQQQKNNNNNNGRPQVVRTEDGGKLGLLQWLRKRVAMFDSSISITNCTTDWQDGRAFCALMASLCPSHFSLGVNQVNSADVNTRLKAAFATAEALGVCQLVDPTDFGLERLSMMTYLSEFHSLDGAKKSW